MIDYDKIKEGRGGKMKENIFILAYRGFFATLYFLLGQKEKIDDLFIDKNEKKENVLIVKKTESREKKKYRYKAKDASGKIINATFDAYNISSAKKYLSSIGLEVLEIKERKGLDVDIYLTSPISISKLSFLLTQLSTYLRSGLTLIDSVELLAKQEKNAERKKIFNIIASDLLIGDNLSTALEHQKNVFPRLLINMVKSSELTGDLVSTLDEMASYYGAIDKTKKEIRSAMTYPTLVFFFSIIVVTFILVWVIPQYQNMFNNFGAKLPAITVATINLSNFIRRNSITILLVIILLLSLYIVCFKKSRNFRLFVQRMYLHIPVVKKIIMYSEVSMFARTFASLLNHSVHISNCMDVLMNITDNEVYRDIIMKTVENVSSGGKISDAFKNHYAIPSVAYEMILTGEETGSLGLMMEKVADYYDNLHTNTVSSLKSLLEPFLIIFLSISVGLIILAVILPMFEMYRVIG